MNWFDKLMPRVVTAFAIRSWRDLVLKLVLFFLLVSAATYLADREVFSPNGALGWATDFWMIILVAAPVLAFQLGVVTYLEKLQHRLEGVEMRDSLTGLPNRRAFMSRIKTARLLHPQGAVMLFDADRFKRINDEYGHDVGDHCLNRIAEALRQNTTEADVIGRLNGTEFAAFIPAYSKTNMEQLGAVMTTGLTHKLMETHINSGREVRITMSIGLVQAGPHHAIEMLLGHADVALCAAKDRGHARMVQWEDMPSTMRKAS